MSTNGRSEIAHRIQTALDVSPPGPYRVSVVEDAIRREDDWWYVPVTPDRAGVRAHEYAEFLTEVENDLRDRVGLKVLLIPTFVNDE